MVKRLMTLLFIGIAIVACGGDSEPTGPLTDTAYSAQGNAICEQMNTELDELSRQASSGVSPEEQRDLFVQANIISSEAIASLFDLSPPASLVDARQSMLDTVEERRQIIDRMNNGEDLPEQLLAVNQKFEDQAETIWPSCTN